MRAIVSILLLAIATIATTTTTNTTDDGLSPSAAQALGFERASYIDGSVTTDSFYTHLPANASFASPGSLLKTKFNSNTSAFTLPPSSSLSRIIYQSKNLNGAPVPVSAFILWPYTPRIVDDGYAVVAWAHAASGISNECAPSHIRNLWQHFLGPYELSSQGYIVVGTDYAGLGVPFDAHNNTIVHEFFASPSQANDVLYSVQAAQSAFPELSKKFVVMGHSEGGGAAWAAAQRQVKQRVTGYLGAVAVSPVTNMIEQTGGEADVLALAMSFGVEAVTPGFNTTQITTPQSQAALDQVFGVRGCDGFIDVTFSALTSFLQDNWRENQFLQGWQARVENGGQEISGPLLILQGTDDEILNFNVTVQQVENTITRFPNSEIQFTALPNIKHIPALQASQPQWMDWIADRFASKSTSGFSNTTASPARPATAQQSTLNYFVAVVTEIFETP